MQSAVVVIGPLGRAIMDRGHVPVVPRRHEVALCFSVFCFGLASFGRCLESRPDVGHFLNSRTDSGEISIGLDAAGCRQIEGSWLVPIDAIRANDIIDGPVLFGKALGRRLPTGLCKTRGRREPSPRDDSGADKMTAVHDIPPQFLIWRPKRISRGTADH